MHFIGTFKLAVKTRRGKKSRHAPARTTLDLRLDAAHICRAAKQLETRTAFVPLQLQFKTDVAAAAAEGAAASTPTCAAAAAAA